MSDDQERPFASGGLVKGPGRTIWDVDAGCLVPMVPMAGDRPVPRIAGVVSIDFRPFIRAMAEMTKRITVLMNKPAMKSAVRRHEDREYLRRVAARELAIGRQALDDHVDSIYADLGLERPV